MLASILILSVVSNYKKRGRVNRVAEVGVNYVNQRETQADAPTSASSPIEVPISSTLDSVGEPTALSERIPSSGQEQHNEAAVLASSFEQQSQNLPVSQGNILPTNPSITVYDLSNENSLM